MINVIVQFAPVIECDKRQVIRLVVQTSRNHSRTYAVRTVKKHSILGPIGPKGIAVDQHYLSVGTPVCSPALQLCCIWISHMCTHDSTYDEALLEELSLEFAVNKQCLYSHWLATKQLANMMASMNESRLYGVQNVTFKTIICIGINAFVHIYSYLRITFKFKFYHISRTTLAVRHRFSTFQLRVYAWLSVWVCIYVCVYVLAWNKWEMSGILDIGHWTYEYPTWRS